jgi:hypothetical protein
MVYEACTHARAEHRTLLEALSTTLPPAVAARLPPLDELLQPAAYLGEAVSIADKGVQAWRAGTVTTHGKETA